MYIKTYSTDTNNKNSSIIYKIKVIFYIKEKYILSIW